MTCDCNAYILQRESTDWWSNNMYDFWKFNAVSLLSQIHVLGDWNVAIRRGTCSHRLAE